MSESLAEVRGVEVTRDITMTPSEPDASTADPTARSGGAEVWAWYAHGDRWLHRSETASCSW